MTALLVWHGFDATSSLPTDWADILITLARSQARYKEITPTSVTSREHSRGLRIPVLTIGGVTLKEHVPWLDALYRSLFLDLGQSVVSEPLFVAQDQRYAINLNVQLGSRMRYESHVDSNPLEGILYATTHPPGSGGELVVSNIGDVVGVEAIAADATRIYPIRGQLIFFDARLRSHYVEPLKRDDDIRVAVTMNFYTASCTEADRPPDLNRHLGLE